MSSKKVKSSGKKKSRKDSQKKGEAVDRSSATAKRNPNRFILPSPISVEPREEVIDPPSLEIHGGWLYPDERYEKIPSSEVSDQSFDYDDNENVPSVYPMLPRGYANMYETLSVRQPYHRCCMCCCCCSCCCCNRQGQISNRFQPMVNRNQSSRMFDKKRTRNQNLGLFSMDPGRRRTSSFPKREPTSPGEKDEEIEMMDRNDVHMATICLNKADDEFKNAVKETNKSKAKEEKSSKSCRRTKTSKRKK